MRSDLRHFRNTLSQACPTLGVRFQDFLDAGLAELLDDAEARNLSIDNVIALFLCFCRTLGLESSFYQAGFLAVMQFLNEIRGNPGDQAYRDLQQTVRQSDNPEQILRWFQGYFG